MSSNLTKLIKELFSNFDGFSFMMGTIYASIVLGVLL